MDRTTNNRSLIIKRVGFAVAAVVAIVLISGLTVMILKKSQPQKPVAEVTKTTVVLTAPQVITSFEQKGSMPGLTADTYQQQVGATSDMYITYKSADETYSVAVPTKSHTSFYAKDKNQPDNSAAIEKNAAQFMKQNDFQKATSPAGDTKADVARTIYSNDVTVCEFSNSIPTKNKDFPPYYSLACVDKVAVADEYATVKKLLLLGAEQAGLKNPTEAIRSFVSEGNKAYSIIRVTDESQKAALLFAAIDDNWEYIGNLSSGDKKYASTKYTITPEIKRAISNPKYGGFLTKYIR